MEPASEVAVITLMVLGTGIVLQQDAAVGAANREVVAFAVAPNQIRITSSDTTEAGDVQD